MKESFLEQCWVETQNALTADGQGTPPYAVLRQEFLAYVVERAYSTEADHPFRSEAEHGFRPKPISDRSEATRVFDYVTK